MIARKINAKINRGQICENAFKMQNNSAFIKAPGVTSK